MKINYKNINITSIAICLIPLLVPSFSLINAAISIISLAIVHLIFTVVWQYIYKFFKDKSFCNLLMIGLPIIILSLLSVCFSLIFNRFSDYMTNLVPYIAVSEILIIMLLYTVHTDIKTNLKDYFFLMIKFAVFLLPIGFLRELVGLVCILGIKLPALNFKGIGFFQHTAGGILLLGILSAVFSWYVNKKEEE